MRRIVGMLALLASTSASAEEAFNPADVSITVTTSSGDSNLVRDFESVSVTKGVFGDIKVNPLSVTVLCSKRWPGALAVINGTVFAINDRARQDLLDGGLSVSGAPVEAVPFDDISTPFAKNPKDTRRISDTALRQCGHSVEESEPKKKWPSESKANAGSTDSVESAYRICMVVDAADIASKPCEVDGWNSSIQITLDVRSAEAKAICRELAKAAKQQSWFFRRGWKIEVFSPYSNGNSIAYCNL